MIKSPCPALLGCSARQRLAPAAMPASSGYDTIYSDRKHAGNVLIHVAVKAFHASISLIHAATKMIHPSNDTVHASFALIHAQNRLFAA
jgi:hypothetical protein